MAIQSVRLVVPRQRAKRGEKKVFFGNAFVRLKMKKMVLWAHEFLLPYPKIYGVARSLFENVRDFGRALITKQVNIEKLLVGGENAIPGGKYARLTNDPLRASLRVSESPHVKFLKEYQRVGPRVLDRDQLVQTDYFKNAAEAIDLCGYYFGAQEMDDIRTVAEGFIRNFDGQNDSRIVKGKSSRTSPVVVRRIASSGGCYEVVDGHHRLAIACVKGIGAYRVHVLREPPVTTPLQDLLLDCLWTKGERIRYQPIDAPEVQTWRLVRQCTDRFELIREWLNEKGLPSNSSDSYLDVGCSYGWFVSQMQRLGFLAAGVERDGAAIKIGKAVYGLSDSHFLQVEISNFCDTNERTFDVVSCFSVLHHFALHKSRKSARDILCALDKMTKVALFFDTGQSHEQWFSATLPEWDDNYIREWVISNTTFSNVRKLGEDRDSRDGFEKNYRRSLFVCTRD